MSYVVWIVTKPCATVYAHFEMFKIIYLKVLYRSKPIMKSGSILKRRYADSALYRIALYRVYSVPANLNCGVTILIVSLLSLCRLRNTTQLRYGTVDKMAGLFTKCIWQP